MAGPIPPLAGPDRLMTDNDPAEGGPQGDSARAIASAYLGLND